MKGLMIVSLLVLAISAYLFVRELQKHSLVSPLNTQARLHAIQSEHFAGMMQAYALPTLNVPAYKTNLAK